MPLRNTQDTYGSLSKTIHWLTVGLILAIIPLGIIANGLPYDSSEQLARKASLFSLHKTLGVTLFLLALFRIGWMTMNPRPGLLNAGNALERTLAQTVHWCLYGSLLLVPLTGWIHHAATTGFAPILWPLGQDLPLVPKSESVAALFAGLHVVLERLLVISLVLHIAGALKHHFVDKDKTLRRMLPGKVEVVAPVTPHSWGPAGLAASAFVAAIGVGAALGVYEGHGSVSPAAQLESVQSEWQVETGTLAITVRQLGSDVTGSFADWTADIRFSETPKPDGTHGSVEVIVAIGSLTLGSVTTQALGSDFFAAEAFPNASFRATIEPATEGYVASGELTLKGTTLPLQLPFSLSLDGENATMSAATQLDRRDYSIGLSQSDAATLGFEVDITVNLTARNAAD